MPGAITQAHVRQMAKDMGIRPDFALGIGDDMAKRIPGAIESAISVVEPNLSPGAKTLALCVGQFVLKTTRQTARSILTA